MQLEIPTINVNMLKGMIDSANIEDCSTAPVLINSTLSSNSITTLEPTKASTTAYDPCETKPCINGLCQSTNSHDYSCTCEYGYVGRNCEKVLKQCELLSPCQNGGICSNIHGSYKCDCQLGFNGKNCEKSKFNIRPFYIRLEYQNIHFSPASLVASVRYSEFFS